MCIGGFLSFFIPVFISPSNYNGFNMYSLIGIIVLCFFTFFIDNKHEIQGKKNEKKFIIDKQNLLFINPSQSVLKILRDILTIKSFIIFLVSFGFIRGTFLYIIISLRLKYNLISIAHPNKLFIPIFYLCGIIGSILFPIFADRINKYKSMLLISSLSSSFFLLASRLTIIFLLDEIEKNNINILIPLYCIEGVVAFFIFGYISVGINYACELSYPNEEGISNGLIELFARIITTIVFSIVYFLRLKLVEQNYIEIILVNVFCAVGILFCFIGKEELKRIEREKTTLNSIEINLEENPN